MLVHEKEVKQHIKPVNLQTELYQKSRGRIVQMIVCICVFLSLSPARLKSEIVCNVTALRL